jgi:hypothetical protein
LQYAFFIISTASKADQLINFYQESSQEQQRILCTLATKWQNAQLDFPKQSGKRGLWTAATEFHQEFYGKQYLILYKKLQVECQIKSLFQSKENIILELILFKCPENVSISNVSSFIIGSDKLCFSQIDRLQLSAKSLLILLKKLHLFILSFYFIRDLRQAYLAV